MKQHIEANKLKDLLLKDGYSFTMSLYGVIQDAQTLNAQYRRIEVFINGQPSKIDVGAIKSFFDEFIPYTYYSIWIYDKKTQQIFCLDEWR